MSDEAALETIHNKPHSIEAFPVVAALKATLRHAARFDQDI